MQCYSVTDYGILGEKRTLSALKRSHTLDHPVGTCNSDNVSLRSRRPVVGLVHVDKRPVYCKDRNVDM